MSWKARHKVTRSHKVVESRARYIGISCIHLRTAHLYYPRICGSDGAMDDGASNQIYCARDAFGFDF